MLNQEVSQSRRMLNFPVNCTAITTRVQIPFNHKCFTDYNQACIYSSGTEKNPGMFRGIKANSTAVDGLTPCVARLWTAMSSAMQHKQVLTFHRRDFPAGNSARKEKAITVL